MHKHCGSWTMRFGRAWALAAVALALFAGNAPAQQKPETRITPQEAKKLFALVDELVKFSSDESGLPIKSQVKRQIISRAAIESYLNQKFAEDEGAKRLERSEIVLKKFGLLERGFALKPFLLALLKEQVEAYYDTKQKTVFLLDWVGAEEQKPVLAHELTHALQDQQVNLEKWGAQSRDVISSNASDDNEQLRGDEIDTARDAVVEGQATAVMMDYALKPTGTSLAGNPEVLDMLTAEMGGTENSPVLARAPVMISESLLFPYREGLRFEQKLWVAQGRQAAFAGALSRPPRSTWEIYNPQQYVRQHVPVVPLLPDVHPLLDKLYKPYDLGQIGQLDLHILTEVYGGEDAADELTPAWEGGIYWAGQRRDATTPADLADTKSVAMFYLSTWKSTEAARAFASLYTSALDRLFASVHPATESALGNELLFDTSEGPVLVTVRGKQVFIAQSFALPLARQLADLTFEAQGAGEWKLAAAPPRTFYSPSATLSGFLARCGVIKAVTQAAGRAAR